MNASLSTGWRRWVSRGLLGLFIFILLSFATIVAAFLFRQDLEVVQTPTGTFIDVQALGEYQANVRRLRITEASTGAVVWELQAQERSFPLWTVPLQLGENEAIPEWLERASVLAPTQSHSFLLLRGKEYRIDLWTFKEHLPRHVSKRFVLS